jgi:nucleotide-binding universal stress UspA family protein
MTVASNAGSPPRGSLMAEVPKMTTHAMTGSATTPTRRIDSPLRRILLAIDASKEAEVARAAAADLARRSGAELHLVTAYQPVSAVVYGYPGYVVPQDLADRLVSEAHELLSAELQQIERFGAHVASSRAGQGPPAEVIALAAAEVDADLVVVGSRGLGALARMMVASVSERVVHTVHRPVLIVRGENAWPPAHVIVGFDHSTASNEAARLAAVIAGLFSDVPLTLVEAIPRDSVPDTHVVPFGELLDIERGHVERRADLLVPLVHRPVQVSIVVDEAANALLEPPAVVRGTALIAIGTRDFGPVKRAVFGSVSTQLLHHGRSPLLVVPASAGAQLRDVDVA